MRFEIIRATKTAHWLRIVGHVQAFARVYTNAPGARQPCPELESAARIAVAAPALLEALRLIGVQSICPDWTHEQAFQFMRDTARAAIAAAELNHA